MNKSTNTTNKSETNVSAAKLSEGLALAATVIATVKGNYETDLAATSALGAWVKRITTGKRGQKVTLDMLVKAFDGAPGTSKSALSKAMKVAATSAVQRKSYLSGAGERPTIDGLYMSVRVVTPRETSTDDAGTDAPESTDDTAERVFTDDMATKVAQDLIDGLRTRGATVLQINLVIAAMDAANVAVQAA